MHEFICLVKMRVIASDRWHETMGHSSENTVSFTHEFPSDLPDTQ